MNIKNKSWYSLIELIIAITIFVIISLIVFAPYGFYMNKAKVKHTNKELSQAIYEAKNMAINGTTTSSWNVSIWIYIEDNSYSLYSFDHNILPSNINLSNWYLIEKRMLQPWIHIDEFQWEDQGIIFFRSITATGLVFKWNNFDLVDALNQNEIYIKYSYKWADNPSLKNTLQYYQDTQIVDY